MPNPRCAHCLKDLGPVIDGEPEPKCDDHMDGVKNEFNPEE